MHYVFDLDGTLVDTEEAVRVAYEQVGVTMPADAFGKTLSEWYKLPSINIVRERKAVAYKNLIHLVNPLPLMDFFKDVSSFWSDNRVDILTGASEPSVKMLCDRFSILNCADSILTGLTLQDKVEFLNNGGPGIVLDDDVRAAQRFRQETRWCVLCSKS